MSAPGPLATAGAVLAVVVRPGLWWTALRQLWRLVPPGWWRRPPHLPVPPVEYLRFRMVTAYGGEGALRMRGDDVVAYLRWCRERA